MKHKRILPLPGTGDDGCPQFAILNSKDAWEVTSWVDLNDAKSNGLFYVNDAELANAPAWIKTVGGMEDGNQ